MEHTPHPEIQDAESGLSIFEDAENGWSIRTVIVDNEPWFVAADVCRVLPAVRSVFALEAVA